MYKVIKFFTDLHDADHPYNVGDEFPREGIEVTQERIDELASDRNKQGVPLIEFILDADNVGEETDPDSQDEATVEGGTADEENHQDETTVEVEKTVEKGKRAGRKKPE